MDVEVEAELSVVRLSWFQGRTQILSGWMRAWIRLSNKMRITDNDPVYDIACRYGWSIVFFEEDLTRNDTFAAILNHIPSTRTSQVESLSFEGNKITASGFQRLNSIVKRSPNFKGLGLRLKRAAESQYDFIGVSFGS